MFNNASKNQEVLLLTTRRENLIKMTKSSKLKSHLKRLYRREAKIGNGSSMDGYRYEKLTGKLLSKNGHLQKL